MPAEKDVAKLDLKNPADLDTAKSYAEAYESRGRVGAAYSLLERISAALGAAASTDKDAITANEAALRRVKALLIANQTDDRKKIAQLALDCLHQLDDAATSQEYAGSILEQQLVNDIARCSGSYYQVGLAVFTDQKLSLKMKSSFVLRLIEASTRNHDTLSHIKVLNQQANDYQRILHSSSGSDKDPDSELAPHPWIVPESEAEEAAARFEREGSLSAALQSYRKVLELKQKKFGLNDPIALSVYGDIARVLAEQGHMEEAEKTYDQEIAAFKKAGLCDYRYVRLLESYGDMLERTNQKGHAAAVYAEATACWKKNEIYSHQLQENSARGR